jgi:hypothetical protein
MFAGAVNTPAGVITSRKRSFVLPHLDKDSSLLPMAGLLQTPGGWPFAKTN